MADLLTMMNEHEQYGIRSLHVSALPFDEMLDTVSTELLLEKQDKKSAVFRAKLKNSGKTPVKIRGIRWGNERTKVCKRTLCFPEELAPHYYTTEHIRNEVYPVSSSNGKTYAAPLPQTTTEIGWSEGWTFPGLYFASGNKPLGLLVAQLTQKRLHPIFRLRGSGKDHCHQFEFFEYPKGVPYITIQPGETIESERWTIELTETSNSIAGLKNYWKTIESSNPDLRSGDTNPLRKQRIYCSWNYDFYSNINEQKMLAQLNIIKEHFPSVNFVQLDDGYQEELVPGKRAMFDFLYDDSRLPYDKERFPEGLKAYADKVKAEGLRPAIWMGLWVSVHSRLFKEHPEWILRLETGEPFVYDKWYGGMAHLDYSLPEVQDYVDHVCKTVFSEWGFEGVKLDFSTMAFTTASIRYRKNDFTAVELRNKLVQTFRKYLPEDGFFGWCIICGVANPFMDGADYYRMGADINNAEWHDVDRIKTSMVNTALYTPFKTAIPNADSIGWSEKLSEENWRTWLNICAVSGMALEVSCDLRKVPTERLKVMNKALEYSNPDNVLSFLDFEPHAENQAPSFWLSEGQETSLLGIFNWNSEPAKFSPAEHAPEPSGWTDAFTGESVDINQTIQLPPCGSILLQHA